MTRPPERVQQLGADQLDLIERAGSYLGERAKRGVDVAVHPDCYLCGWASVRGNARLRRLAGCAHSAIPVLVARAKDALNGLRSSDCELTGEAAPPSRIDQLVISWSRRTDFAADGEYRDRYFRTSSRETPTSLWFLISVDQVAPLRLDPNIRVFSRSLGGRSSLNLARLGSMIRRTKGSKQREHGTVPAPSENVALADQIVAAVDAQLMSGRIRSVVIPYEAQPFQNAVFRAAKARDPSITTVGYIHSALPPVPTDLIRRTGAPERLLVHGRGQAQILIKHLGWPAAAIRTIPSLRYRAGDVNTLNGFIFLPYSFDDARTIERAFSELLRATEPGSLPRLAVRNHPEKQDSPHHQLMQQRLETTMRRFEDRFYDAPPDEHRRKKASIFVGATAAIVEALEHGVSVFHICSHPLTEAHTPEIWSELMVERLGENIFWYQLVKPGAYIDFGDKSEMFETYIRQPLHEGS